MRCPFDLLVVGLVAVVLGGCGDDADEEAAPSAPAVGILELPVSLRSSDAAPSGALRVEISPAELRLDGKTLLPLSKGKVAGAQVQGDKLPKLEAAAGGSSKATVALEAHAATPYRTLARVLNSLAAANARKVAFKVRKRGAGTETGWLALAGFDVVTPEQTPEFANLTPRSWDDFAKVWSDVYTACRSAASGDCRHPDENIAEEGDLGIVLHASGDGLTLKFERVGGPALDAGEPAPAQQVELLDGVQRDIVKEVEEAPPATEAMFQFRSKEVLQSSSAVSASMAPLCARSACGVTFRADPTSMLVRVVSLLGAAFPDGTPAPTVAFQL